MVLSLTRFVEHINGEEGKKDLLISIRNVGDTKIPVSIEVRFQHLKRKKLLTLDNFRLLEESVDFKSKGTVLLASNIKMFERGIIELKVSPTAHNYDEIRIISLLGWIKDELLDPENPATEKE